MEPVKYSSTFLSRLIYLVGGEMTLEDPQSLICNYLLYLKQVVQESGALEPKLRMSALSVENSLSLPFELK